MAVAWPSSGASFSLVQGREQAGGIHFVSSESALLTETTKLFLCYNMVFF